MGVRVDDDNARSVAWNSLSGTVCRLLEQLTANLDVFIQLVNRIFEPDLCVVLHSRFFALDRELERLIAFSAGRLTRSLNRWRFNRAVPLIAKSNDLICVPDS